jgi:zona occludens toxin
MPIEFRSGLPGSSKTLGAVDHLMDLRKTSPERPVYVLGITDLREGLAHDLTQDQLEHWQDLPPNSIILVDECQRYMPARRAGDPPKWIKDLSTHRHLGLDFILISQHPALIDNYVRRLIDRHIHHVRKFGTHWCDRWEWPELQSEPTSSSAKKGAHSRKVWKFSKTAMAAYKSAEVHTVKRRLPPILFIAAVCVPAIPLLFWFAWHHMHSLSKAPTVASVAAAEGKSLGGSGSSVKAPETASDWIKDRIPRVAGIPWSAPLFDKQSVVANPDLYCMSIVDADGSKRCTCVTEQGTHADVPGAMCIRVAQDGIYNPYRKPLADIPPSVAQVSNSAPPTSQMSPAPNAYAASGASPTSSAGGGSGQGLHASYAPPTTLPWNAEAFGTGK